MTTIRICQILFVFLIGTFAALVALNNVRDPQSNLRFVEHLMRMDTIFPDSRLHRRAIDSPGLHRLFFALIIVTEAVTAVLCMAGSVVLAMHLGAPAEDFHAAKAVAFAGLGLGFALWFGGFMIIGGQWFASWQSKQWSGRESAFMFYSAIGMAFLALLHQT
jgi:predicted small integral membrane protein